MLIRFPFRQFTQQHTCRVYWHHRLCPRSAAVHSPRRRLDKSNEQQNRQRRILSSLFVAKDTLTFHSLTHSKVSKQLPIYLSLLTLACIPCPVSLSDNRPMGVNELQELERSLKTQKNLKELKICCRKVEFQTLSSFKTLASCISS